MAVPHNSRDSKGLFVRDGLRRIYLTNPLAWRAAEDGDLVLAKVPSWGPYWTATWRKAADRGEAGVAMVDWLKAHTEAAPASGENREETLRTGALFRKILVASVREAVDEKGHLSGPAADAYAHLYNRSGEGKLTTDRDEKGAYAKEAGSKVYLLRPLEGRESLYLFWFGTRGQVRVAAPGRTSKEALEDAGDWLRRHARAQAPDPDLPLKDKGKLRVAMRRLGLPGRFDNLTGREQEDVLALVAKEYIEVDGGFLSKRGFKEKKLTSGLLLRKLKALGVEMEGGAADLEDTEALAQIYGSQSRARRRSASTKVSPKIKRDRSSVKKKKRPTKKPKRRLKGVGGR